VLSTVQRKRRGACQRAEGLDQHTGLPRFHDELPVIADECSRSIQAILSTVFTGGGVQMQLRKQSAKIPQTDFFGVFSFFCLSSAKNGI
jgi:hypothetical protein